MDSLKFLLIARFISNGDALKHQSVIDVELITHALDCETFFLVATLYFNKKNSI